MKPKMRAEELRTRLPSEGTSLSMPHRTADTGLGTVALMGEDRAGSSLARGSPSSTSLHPPGLNAHHGRGVPRPRGRFAGTAACYQPCLSSRARVSIHLRVKGTRAFQKSDPKVRPGRVNKDTKANREPTTSPHRGAPCPNSCPCHTQEDHARLLSSLQPLRSPGTKQGGPGSTAWALLLQSEGAADEQECSGLVQPRGRSGSFAWSSSGVPASAMGLAGNREDGDMGRQDLTCSELSPATVAGHSSGFGEAVFS